MDLEAADELQTTDRAGDVRAMDVEAAVYQTHGDAPEHSTGQPRIPIIEVAFGKGMWSSSNGQLRFHARGMLPSRHCYRECNLRVQLC